MAILNKIYLLACAAALTGCHEIFDPGIDVEPVLCVNSLITAGRPVKAEISRTRLYNSPNSDSSVSDARLTVYSDGELCDESYIAAEGDRIRVVAESDTYGRAEAEVVVPVSAEISSFSWGTGNVINSADSSTEGYAMRADVRFDLGVELEMADTSPFEANYYRVTYVSFYHAGEEISDDLWGRSECEFSTGTLDYELEPIFSEHIGVFESYMGSGVYGTAFFTDRQFVDGKYTLRLTFTGLYYDLAALTDNPEFLDCGIIVYLDTTGKSFYDWANYRWQTIDGPLGDMADIGMADPIAGYSNVSTGAGVVAALSSKSVTVNLNDFLKQFIKTQE